MSAGNVYTLTEFHQATPRNPERFRLAPLGRLGALWSSFEHKTSAASAQSYGAAFTLWRRGRGRVRRLGPDARGRVREGRGRVRRLRPDTGGRAREGRGRIR